MRLLVLLIIATGFVARFSAVGADVDLRPFADTVTPLPNPHKGWYHHYPDNHINKYKIKADSDLLNFPGMDHLYIRLAWAYLEPKEGQFDWSVIDDLISKWTSRGLGISFRISCKETSTDRVEQQFATPRWVKEAGARGGHYRMGNPAGDDAPWEPVFDDPVFLQKLENFIRAFAERYDGQPWLRYVDVGSIGDWGEGHTWAGSRKKYDFEQRKVHVDLYSKYFVRSQVVISDDFVYETGGPQERQRMHQYVLNKGIAYRDDSILVDGYFAGTSGTATVRSPEFFTDSYKRLPAVLELEHYSAVKRAGNWLAAPGSSIAKHGGGRNGPAMLREALLRLHATYIGYHGDPAEWLAENRELTAQLLNLSGYWYFLNNARLPDVLEPAKGGTLQLAWENRGAAPAYTQFKLHLAFDGPSSFEVTMPAENINWMPRAGQVIQDYAFRIPPAAAHGLYRFKLKLSSAEAKRDVLLALRPELRDISGYYRIGEVRVGKN